MIKIIINTILIMTLMLLTACAYATIGTKNKRYLSSDEVQVINDELIAKKIVNRNTRYRNVIGYNDNYEAAMTVCGEFYEVDKTNDSLPHSFFGTYYYKITEYKPGKYDPQVRKNPSFFYPVIDDKAKVLCRDAKKFKPQKFYGLNILK